MTRVLDGLSGPVTIRPVATLLALIDAQGSARRWTLIVHDRAEAES